MTRPGRRSRFDIRPHRAHQSVQGMKTRGASSDRTGTVPGGGRSRGASAARVGRAVGDILLFAAFLGLAVLFLQHSGFIGNGDIQPYPY